MERYKSELMTYGYTIVPPALACPDNLQNRLLDAVVGIAAKSSKTSAQQSNVAANPMGEQFFYLLANNDPCFLEAVMNPALVELVRYLIHEPIISSVSANLKPRNDVNLPLHADQPIHPSPRSLVCTAAYVLTPSSKEFGGMCFVPGSHHLMRQPTPEEEDLNSAASLVSVEAEPGSLLIWHANTWHGAHRRALAGARVHLLLHWCSRWIRPQEPYRERLSDEIVARGGAEFEELLGASIYYGWTDAGPEHAPRAAFETARDRRYNKANDENTQRRDP